MEQDFCDRPDDLTNVRGTVIKFSDSDFSKESDIFHFSAEDNILEIPNLDNHPSISNHVPVIRKLNRKTRQPDYYGRKSVKHHANIIKSQVTISDEDTLSSIIFIEIKRNKVEQANKFKAQVVAAGQKKV